MPLSNATILKYSPIFFGGVLFLADRIFKYLATTQKINYFINYYFVFGLPSRSVIILMTNLVILFVVIFLWKRDWQPALIFIILGGVSNFLDRLLYGGVIDYIFIIPSAPANLADIMILGGIIGYAWAKRKNLSS